MRFTVILDSAEAEDHSFGLVFVPSPVWVQGARTILNLNPENPRYKVGSVRRLLDEEQIEVGRDMSMRAVVVAHPEGNGTFEDFAELIRDLEFEGFSVSALKVG
jgi:hypothetical protein